MQCLTVKTMHSFTLFLLTALISYARGGEVCCQDIGCFSDDSPFDHYRLPRCPEDLPTSYELFTSTNRANGEDFNKFQIPSHYDFSKRTVLLAHGYMNNRNSKYLFDLKDALLTADDFNVIIVGWGGIVDYPVAASTTRTVGSDAAVMVDNLVRNGANYADMWCVGFSLGAHVCGHVGMASDGPFGRITGLDPAGPWFENYAYSTGLNPTAAEYVDVIHTMAHNFLVNWGMLRPVGHIDFYPNGGDNLQPGCLTYSSNISLNEMEHYTTPEDFMGFDTACSHGRAVDFFLESILSDCFVARETCTDVAKMPRSCSPCNGGGECARMGFRAQGSGPDGVYYLETKGRSPFCKN